jgi:hypothetical protein
VECKFFDDAAEAITPADERELAMFTCKHVLGLAVAVAASFGLSSLAKAATYSVDLIEGTTLGAADYGTVTYTDVAGGVQVSVTLSSGDLFLNAGQDATFAFNLTSTAFANATVTAPSGYTAVTGNLGASNPKTLSMDGQGLLSNGVLSNTHFAGSTLSFVVSGVTTSDFILSTNPPGSVASLFAADIATGCTTTSGNTTCASTGIVGTATPLPGALLLFGTVLAGGLGVSRWRKQLQRGPVSVMA